MTSDNGVILTVVTIYMAAMLGIGYWSGKRVHHFSDFLVAGRRLPFWLATATLFATWFGAGSCLGAAGASYTDGVMGVIADPFAAGASLMIAGIFYVGYLRRLKLLTITDIFGKYYGAHSEIFASILMVPVYVGWLGSQIVAIGYLINFLTGMNALAGMVIGAVVILIYTWQGGMWAVSVTDFVQAIILILGLWMIFFAVLSHVGSLGRLLQMSPSGFWDFVPAAGDYKSWWSYLGQWLTMGLGCVVGQDLIQRSLSSRTEGIAKRSAVTAGVMYIIIGLIPILLGLAGRFVLGEVNNPEMVIPQLASLYLPPLPIAFFIAALLCAIMSSADSSLLAACSLIVNNISRPLKPHTSSAGLLAQTRFSMVIVMILSTVIALCVQQIYDLMINSWATLFVAIFVPVTAALYWHKANAQAAWGSMVLGLLGWISSLIVLSQQAGGLNDEVLNQAAVVGGAASFLGYGFITLVLYDQIKPVKIASDY